MIRWKILNEAHQFNPLDIENFLRNFELTLKSSKGFTYLLKKSHIDYWIREIKEIIGQFCEALNEEAEPEGQSVKWKIVDFVDHVFTEDEVEAKGISDSWIGQTMFYTVYESQINCWEGANWNSLVKTYYKFCQGDEGYFPKDVNSKEMIFEFWTTNIKEVSYRLIISKINNKQYKISLEVAQLPKELLDRYQDRTAMPAVRSAIRSINSLSKTPVQPKKIRVVKRNSQ